VKKAVSSVEGTSDIEVDLDGKIVTFVINAGGKIADVKEAITAAGFSVHY
jgi:copper chaperone CopZ